MSASLQPAPARTAVLADYMGRRLRGVMAAPQPIAWPARRTFDQLDYWLDCAVLLDPAGDSLAAVSIATSPSASENDLQVEWVIGRGCFAGFFLTGGVLGTHYSVALEITTTRGRTANVRGCIEVSGLGLAPDTSGETTWQYQPTFDFSDPRNSGYLALLAGF